MKKAGSSRVDWQLRKVSDKLIYYQIEIIDWNKTPLQKQLLIFLSFRYAQLQFFIPRQSIGQYPSQEAGGGGGGPLCGAALTSVNPKPKEFINNYIKSIRLSKKQIQLTDCTDEKRNKGKRYEKLHGS